MAEITVVIASLGRPTLKAALESAAEQLWWDDELIVVFDDRNAPVFTLQQLVEFGLDRVDDWERYACDGFGRGGAQKNRGAELAHGSHLYFLDDDNVLQIGALDLMHAFAHPDVPTIFRVDHPSVGTIWKTPVLEYGNVDTSCLLVPNHHLGQWVPYEGENGNDFGFITSTCARQGAPVWREERLATYHPVTSTA